MVWIHGGGFVSGSKTASSPSPAGLLRASQSNGKGGVVWVSINYRLGIFVRLLLPFQTAHPSIFPLTR